MSHRCADLYDPVPRTDTPLRKFIARQKDINEYAQAYADVCKRLVGGCRYVSADTHPRVLDDLRAVFTLTEETPGCFRVDMR